MNIIEPIFSTKSLTENRVTLYNHYIGSGMSHVRTIQCCLKLSVVLEVLHLVIRVGDNGVCARLPSGRANLSVFVCVLEGLHQTQSFVYTPSHRRSFIVICLKVPLSSMMN